ncbi:MAG TPA: cyclase family protein [Solirubrobacteraceae bacterium]|nr:cyclase family protein [Solirubrobacteraceae bacterium]
MEVAEPNPETELLAALAQLRVHDASPLIEPGMAMFALHPAPAVEPLTTHGEQGVAANRLTLAEHTGSHVDAPFHFDPAGETIDRIAPDALLLRPYKKFDLSPLELQPGQTVGEEELREAAARGRFVLAAGDVAIVEMGWDRYLAVDEGDASGAFWGRNEPGLDESACSYLADAGVTAVASDTAACDIALRDGEIGEAHGHTHWFLPRGILIVEGLRGLAEVAATGLFAALPLKIAGGTGSPLRVLLLHRG